MCMLEHISGVYALIMKFQSRNLGYPQMTKLLCRLAFKKISKLIHLDDNNRFQENENVDKLHKIRPVNDASITKY